MTKEELTKLRQERRKQVLNIATKIAVAYADKGRYNPWEIGEKAVEVADGVVDKLKNERK